MATVKGPLLSIAAHGTIGNAILFRRINGRDVCSASPRPPTQAHPAQELHRGLMKAARLAWRNATDEERDEWRNREAHALRCSGYNLYIQNWFRSNIYGRIPIYGLGIFGWPLFQSSTGLPAAAFFDDAIYNLYFFEETPQ